MSVINKEKLYIKNFMRYMISMDIIVIIKRVRIIMIK